MNTSEKRHPLQLLLVEDNPADVMLLREGLRVIGTHHVLHVVSDGEQAMQFLRRQGPFAAVPIPDLILLDLNLPVKDGREVLYELHQDERLQCIPVVVLTTAESRSDVCQAYHLGASSFLTKPGDLDEYFSMVRAIELFWGQHARLPSDCVHG